MSRMDAGILLLPRAGALSSTVTQLSYKPFASPLPRVNQSRDQTSMCAHRVLPGSSPAKPSRKIQFGLSALRSRNRHHGRIRKSASIHNQQTPSRSPRSARTGGQLCIATVSRAWPKSLRIRECFDSACGTPDSFTASYTRFSSPVIGSVSRRENISTAPQYRANRAPGKSETHDRDRGVGRDHDRFHHIHRRVEDKIDSKAQQQAEQRAGPRPPGRNCQYRATC